MGTDYTACDGDHCPIKNTCLRFIGPRDSFQNYFDQIPGKYIEHSDDEFNSGLETVCINWECDMFWGETQSPILNQLKDNVKRMNSKKKIVK